MADPFLGEIRIFAGTFAPRDWALCDGSLLPVAQNSALFSLLGTIYGGDGRTNFALPDLRGRAPMHPGNGPGLTARSLGQNAGAETVTLAESQLPIHTHAMTAGAPLPGDQDDPAVNTLLGRPVGGSIYAGAQNLVPMADETTLDAGGGGAHPNMQPYLTLNFIIALAGVFPSRN